MKNRGCSGLTYTLDYTDKKEKFDESVSQDGRRNHAGRGIMSHSLIGLTVLIDSKAVFSVIGSEMDYVEDELSSKFIFSNPNIKETCGCGMSFMVGNPLSSALAAEKTGAPQNDTNPAK